MDESKNGSERFEGIDRTVLDEDVWAPEPEMIKCPECDLRVPIGTLRCPRCNRFLLMGCSGSCSSCGSRACTRTDAPKGR
jgi:uncharacterized paraquat-inducible protein A